MACNASYLFSYFTKPGESEEVKTIASESRCENAVCEKTADCYKGLNCYNATCTFKQFTCNTTKVFATFSNDKQTTVFADAENRCLSVECERDEQCRSGLYCCPDCSWSGVPQCSETKNKPDDKEKGSKTLAVIFGILGGFLALGLVAAGVFYYQRKKRLQAQLSQLNRDSQVDVSTQRVGLLNQVR